MLLKKYIQFIEYVVSRPFYLVVFSIFLLVSSFPIFNIHTDSTGEGWYPKNSKQLILKNQFIKDFGSDELMMLYLTFPDSSSSQSRMNSLQKVSASVSSLYGFENILSRTNISAIKDLMGNSYANKIEHSYFNSIDSSGEMIFLKVRLNKNINSARPLLIDSLNKILHRVLPKGVKTYLSGPSVVFTEIDRLSTTDSVKLFTLCFILIFLLLWWQIRRIKYLLISFFLVLLAIIPSLSLFGWLNIPFNMITMTVPLLFVINFSSFAIHIITKQSIDIKQYLLKKIPPIITSALTIIIGFGSLMASNIRLISQFGLLTSLGIIVGLLSMLIVGVPLVARYISVSELVDKESWLNRILDKYYYKLSLVASYCIFAFMLIVMVSGFCIFPTIKTDSNMINLMKPGNEVRKTIEFIEKHYGSANVIDFLILKKDQQPIGHDDLKTIAKMNIQVAKLPFVKNVIGYDLWSPLINRTSGSNSKLSSQLSSDFLTSDKRQSRIVVNIPSGSVKQMERMLNTIQVQFNKTLLGSNLEISPVGFLPMYVEQMNTIVDGMLYGLAIAIILILVVMTLLVRNIKLGLITTLITLFPLCGLSILMKILNIPFDVGTSIISSVAIGMIADDSIHIIWNYKRHVNRSISGTENQSINHLFANAVRKIVYPCTVTSLMFSIGFSVLIFSNMVTLIDFGILSATTILLAWIGDFIFFPALLKIFNIGKTQK